MQSQEFKGENLHDGDEINLQMASRDILSFDEMREKRRLEELQFEAATQEAYRSVRHERIRNQNDDESYNPGSVKLFAVTSDDHETIVNSGLGLGYMREKYLDEQLMGERPNNVTWLDTSKNRQQSNVVPFARPNTAHDTTRTAA